MKAEVTVIKLGEDWFEIKKVEPPKQEVEHHGPQRGEVVRDDNFYLPKIHG